MDETRLNIEAPLLSVRRCSSTSISEPKRNTLDKRHTLPYPKSDLTITLNQFTEPITVPFNWEHIPGRSKRNNDPPILHQGTKRGSSSNGDDDDDVFSDALDTMSPSQSFFMNCSVSGISGIELDNINATKSRTLDADSKSRDFMMDRFLPAAKAMTLQPLPQYAAASSSSSRKQQCVAVEQPREVDNRSNIREEKKLLLKKHISDILQKSSHCESEDDDGDDHHEYADVSAKGCGLFPQLRIKNSLCLLNPIPVMKIRNQFPLVSSNSNSLEVVKVKPNKGSHVRSYSPAPAVKKAIDAIYKNKSSCESVSRDIGEARKKWISQSCRFSSSGETQQQGRLSPFRRSRAAAAAAGVSPSRIRPQYPFRGARLAGESREAENNQSDRLNFHSKGHEIGNSTIQENNNSAVEKTLYIDTASTVKLSSSHSYSMDTMVEKEHNSTLESSEEKNMLDSDINNKQIVIVDDDNSGGSGGVGSGLCPLPPPLPKSPSESWLWRALPLVSVRNPLMHSNVGAYSQSKSLQDCFTTSGNNTKWETIVKTSNLHDDHVRYSQELITTHHISQHLKS
ncbi:uncharacterized protein G2W53_042429 [Senna tora]|uniref:Uncharacterized protein n=1 Tax=Senna tora TaxID=362788 RepID=A0A834SG00_9FABA|nr:uncharacterized protein G2W53_042429 [Senna tora]